MKSPINSLVKNLIPNMMDFSLVVYDLANAWTDLLHVHFTKLLKREKSKGEAC